MSQQPYIVSFGEALVDILPSGEVVGGAPLNCAIRTAEWCSVAPQRAAMVTRLGSDERGERILGRLRETELNLDGVQIDGCLPTGHVDVEFHDGQPAYSIADNVAWDAIAWDPQVAQLAQQAACICFGTLAQRHHASRLTLQRLLETAPHDAVRILDINVRKPFPTVDVVKCGLQAANILKCNEEELLLLAGWLDLDSRRPLDIACEVQQRFGLKAIFWTRGADGCRWQDGNHLVEADVPQLPTADDADSVGAGDAATAALAIGAVNGWAPERIVAAANLCGAFAASQRGATVPMPPDVLERLKHD
jgi:fructokinase